MSKKQTETGAKAQEVFYTDAFKQRVVAEVLSGNLTKRQASLIYGIRGHATVLCWMREFKNVSKSKTSESISYFSEMKASIQQKKLEAENKELKELLRLAELRADLWQHAIEVAEDKLNIKIVKKSGAQQSPVSKTSNPKKK